VKRKSTEPDTEFLDNQRQLLFAKKDECTRILSGVLVGGTIVADVVDEKERLANAHEEYIDMGRSKILRAILLDVSLALDAMSHGKYGVCCDCEEQIAHNRLKAVPWARRCISCQEEVGATPVVTGSARVYNRIPRGHHEFETGEPRRAASL